MGIRTLHRRTVQARTAARTDATAAPSMPPSWVQALAADASTARIPVGPAAAVRGTAGRLRHRLATRADRTLAWRQWADLCRGYLALLLALIPRKRPARRMTVFVAPLTERPYGSAPSLRTPGPDATP